MRSDQRERTKDRLKLAIIVLIVFTSQVRGSTLPESIGCSEKERLVGDSHSKVVWLDNRKFELMTEDSQSSGLSEKRLVVDFRDIFWNPANYTGKLHLISKNFLILVDSVSEGLYFNEMNISISESSKQHIDWETLSEEKKYRLFNIFTEVFTFFSEQSIKEVELQSKKLEKAKEEVPREVDLINYQISRIEESFDPACFYCFCGELELYIFLALITLSLIFSSHSWRMIFFCMISCFFSSFLREKSVDQSWTGLVGPQNILLVWLILHSFKGLLTSREAERPYRARHGYTELMEQRPNPKSTKTSRFERLPTDRAYNGGNQLIYTSLEEEEIYEENISELEDTQRSVDSGESEDWNRRIDSCHRGDEHPEDSSIDEDDPHSYGSEHNHFDELQ